MIDAEKLIDELELHRRGECPPDCSLCETLDRLDERFRATADCGENCTECWPPPPEIGGEAGEGS